MFHLTQGSDSHGVVFHWKRGVDPVGLQGAFVVVARLFIDTQNRLVTLHSVLIKPHESYEVSNLGVVDQVGVGELPRSIYWFRPFIGFASSTGRATHTA
jgi:hypothetical protein